MTPKEKFFNIDFKSINDEDLTTVDECVYVMIALDSIIATIDEQLTEAKRKAIVNHEYSDPKWYRDATRALKRARRTRVIAQEKRGKLAGLERQARNNLENTRRERAFVNIARVVLDRETYLKIWEIVNTTIE